MKYKVAIFDMDGTLLDTASDIFECVNIYLEKFGYPLKSLDDIRHAMGGGANALVHKMLPEGISEADFETFFKEYIPYYETHGKDKTAPYPGVLELLVDLKNQGTKLVVVSSKPHKGVVVTWGYRDIEDLLPLNPQFIANNSDELRKILL